MLGINQAYFSKYKCKTHKYYNDLQSIFNEKLFTKDIKNAKHQSSGLVDQWFMRIKAVEHKGLKASLGTAN